MWACIFVVKNCSCEKSSREIVPQIHGRGSENPPSYATAVNSINTLMFTHTYITFVYIFFHTTILLPNYIFMRIVVIRR